MPVFNETKTVAQIIAAVLAQPCVAQLVIVDDASTDATWEILQTHASEPRINLLRHTANRGKGAALRTAFAAATAPIVLVQDADLEYDPGEYEKLIAPIVSGHADVVFGSRFLGAEARRVLYFWHSIGNRFLTLLSNAFTNLNLSDMETCYKVLRRELLDQITLEEDRFGIEPELTAKLAALGVSIYEVSISYHGRTFAQGKKVNWRDGVSALRSIVKYNLLRRAS